MKGIQIFRHSVRMVLGNWKQILQIALVPVAAVILVWGLAAGTLPNDPGQLGGGSAGAILLSVLVSIVVVLSIVVNWHRFVLLEEYPVGWIPPMPFGLMLGYLGRSLLIGLLLLIIIVPVGMMSAGIMFQSPGLALVIMFAISIVGSFLFFRLSAILPAGAVEDPLRMGEAWKATASGSGDIFVLVIVLTVANFLISGLGEFGGAATLLSGLFQVVLGLVNVSALTTIYGHYVKGLPID